MSDAVAVGLHVEFEFFVFLYDVLFDVFHINAGIFDGRLFVPAGHFDGDARLRIGLLNFVARLGFRRGRILGRRRLSEEHGQREAERTNRLKARLHEYLNSILHGMTWFGQVPPSVALDANLTGGAACPTDMAGKPQGWMI